MSKHINIKRGLDLKLKGTAEKISSDASADIFAVKPTDFHGIIPKLMVKPGTKVKAGDPVFHSKKYPEMLFCSPVSGEVTEIRRGEKRKILEIVIVSDSADEYKSFTPKAGSRKEIIQTLCEAGLWPFIKQRPYDVVAHPDDTPKAIHVSGFNTEPLTADLDFAFYGNDEDFQRGFDIITQLTDGKTHLNIHDRRTTGSMFKNAKGVTINTFSGPHPAGIVGIQINNIDPINKGERVWTISALGVVTIGKFFNTGKYDMSRLVALSGGPVKKPKYYKFIAGGQVSNLVNGNLSDEHVRVISGGVLTGTNVGKEGFLGFYDNTVTVVREGDKVELFGWLAPGLDKFSMSHTFLSWLMPGKIYDLDTNLHGEHRPFVMTGEYEKVFPMDIYPQQLIKAIITEDLDKMEQLGIYEVAPEDFSLCEFVCTSKMELQKIVREGLDLAQKELG